jgi:hypothetical protein
MLEELEELLNYLGLSKNGECCPIMAVREENFNPDVDDLR